MFVIGVAGQMTAGKDTLADRLLNRLQEQGQEWQKTSFASNVKKVYCEVFGVDLDFIEKWKRIHEPPPGFLMSVRKSLQFIGDGFREIQSTIWLDLVFRDRNPKIISDVRYINEFRRVKKEGGLNILVGGHSRMNNDPNGSEALIRPYVEWMLEHSRDLVSPIHASRDGFTMDGLQYSVEDGPPFLSEFDIFVRNDGNLEEYYHSIDNMVLPFVVDFGFNKI